MLGLWVDNISNVRSSRALTPSQLIQGPQFFFPFLVSLPDSALSGLVLSAHKLSTAAIFVPQPTMLSCTFLHSQRYSRASVLCKCEDQMPSMPLRNVRNGTTVHLESMLLDNVCSLKKRKYPNTLKHT